jgi:hypothetical protein
MNNTSFFYLGKLKCILPSADELESRFEPITFDSVDPFHNREDKRLCWQYYGDSNIYFSRNFSFHYYDLCSELAKELISLQEDISKKGNLTELEEIFVKQYIVPHGFAISKSKGDVAVHYDDTRDYSINIGLFNCGNARTISSTAPKLAEFDQYPKVDYIVNKSDIYLFNTKRYHCVEQMSPSDEFRYIITYSIR